MKKRMRKQMGTRVLSIFLAVAIFVGILPADGMVVHAAGEDYHDFQRIESLEGAGRPLAINHQHDGGYVLYSPMLRGERTAIQYSMPYNGIMSATVYRFDVMAEEAYEYATSYENKGVLPTTEEWEHLKSTQKAKLDNAVKDNLTEEELAAETCEEGEFIGYLYGEPYYDHLEVDENGEIVLVPNGWFYQKHYKEINSRLVSPDSNKIRMKNYFGAGFNGKDTRLTPMMAMMYSDAYLGTVSQGDCMQMSVSEGDVSQGDIFTDTVS